ncbi:MAG TPA: MarR family transcriptional regulator [Candidatus Cybelea sp.]|nr:MarR family transcriptional regulator [Candidatus Cybelea sp.]
MGKRPPLSHDDLVERTSAVSRGIVRRLALFRFRLRKFLRFSEQAARSCGLTPQQYQLLLGIAGFTTGRNATISELAEFMQKRHNSVVELVVRAVRRGLVRKERDAADRRCVFVSLTSRGEAVLMKLVKLHAQEIRRLPVVFLGPGTRGRKLPAKKRNVRERA